VVSREELDNDNCHFQIGVPTGYRRVISLSVELQTVAELTSQTPYTVRNLWLP